MNKGNTEIEAKYYVRDFESLRSILRSLGAKRIGERIFERNWRFDTPDRTLTQRGEVLRIRKDLRCRLTYKRPIQGTLERMEIEIEVDDWSKTKMFLEAIGYEVFFIYEKYRETYEVDDTEVVLDEVPYGHFVEIEGPSVESIRRISAELHLEWDYRLSVTYLSIFKQMQKEFHLPFRDATFEAFSQFRQVLPKELNLKDGFLDDPSSEGSS
jgi:adenylate cyclase class 2